MDGNIVFYIHGSTIEYGGTLFDAGALTTDILNLGPREYAPFHDQLQLILSLAKQYESMQDRGIWWELNGCLMELRSQLSKYRVFQILLQDDQQLFQEAQQYTQQFSFLPEEEMDWRMTTPEQWEAAATQEEENQIIPPQLLIYPGSRREKWLYYRKQIDRYQRYLEEVAANSSENYAAALYQFYNDERLVEKLIVNPMGLEHSFYQKYDHCVVSYVPRELPDGKFAICQEHTTDSLQMGALSARNIFWYEAAPMCSTARGNVRWMSALPAGNMAAMRFRRNWHGMCRRSRPKSLLSTASERIISGGLSQRRK